MKLKKEKTLSLMEQMELEMINEEKISMSHARVLSKIEDKKAEKKLDIKA